MRRISEWLNNMTNSLNLTQFNITKIIRSLACVAAHRLQHFDQVAQRTSWLRRYRCKRFRQLRIRWAERNCEITPWIAGYERRAWRVKKSHQHSGKITEAIYLQVSEQAEIAKEEGRPISVSGMLRFHALIKREWLNRFRIRDFNHAHSLIFEYIEAFYNTKRIHSHCGYLSPDDFEKLYNASVARESRLVSWK